MKKQSLILTLALAGALVLSACAGAGGNQNATPGAGAASPEAGQNAERDALGTASPFGGSDFDQTPEEGIVPDTGAATPDSTGAAATPATEGEAPATSLELTATPVYAEGPSLTPQPGAASDPGQAADSSAREQFVLLSDVLRSSVRGQDGAAVGNVSGVLIDPARSAGSSAGAANMGENAGQGDQTPQTGDLTATPTQALENTTPERGQMNGTASAEASFVLVQLTGSAGDSQVLIPWEAFDDAQNNDTAGTAENELVLAVDAGLLASAPRFEQGDFQGQINPDVHSYWANQGLGIPATGDAQPAEPAAAGDSLLVRGQFGSLSLRDAQGQTIGQVRDLLIDAQSGEIAYAVLSGGSAFGGDVYVVPFSLLAWQPGQGQGANLGDFQSNVPQESFSGAPALGSVDELQSDSTWTSEVDQYWNRMK